MVLRPARAFDDAFVSLRVPGLFSASKVPDLDDAVAAAACEALEGEGIFGHGVDTVDMTVAQLGDEGGGEHSVKLRGIEGSGIFSCSFEGVESWVEIARLAGNTRAWGLVRRRRSCEGLDFLQGRSLACIELSMVGSSHHLVTELCGARERKLFSGSCGRK